MLHPFLKNHHSLIGHGWELVDGHCHPVRHTRPALSAHLPAPGLEAVDKTEEMNMRRLIKKDLSDPEFSEEECSDSN